MYAITATSYRAISSAAELLPGETASATVPASTLRWIAAAGARIRRDALLRSCDWTMGSDAPLAADQVAAWKTYRQALRDVPGQAGFPQSLAWPSPPSAENH